MNGSFTGRIGKGAEVRSTRDGKTLGSFPVAVDTKADGEAPATWVRVAFFGDTVGTVASRLTKGTEIYCERRLSLGTWTGRDGEAKVGLNLAATTHVGRRKPRRKPQVRSRDEYGGVPFNDLLRF